MSFQTPTSSSCIQAYQQQQKAAALLGCCVSQIDLSSLYPCFKTLGQHLLSKLEGYGDGELKTNGIVLK